MDPCSALVWSCSSIFCLPFFLWGKLERLATVLVTAATEGFPGHNKPLNDAAYLSLKVCCCSISVPQETQTHQIPLAKVSAVILR